MPIDYKDKLQEEIRKLVRQEATKIARQSGLSQSAIEGGGITINDALGNYLTTVGLHPDGTYGVGYNIDSTVIKDGGIETPSLAANSITADKLEALLVLVTAIIAGNPDGAAAVMDKDGFRTLAVGPDGTQYVSTRLGTADGSDSLEIFADASEPPVAAISSSGDVSGATVASNGDVSIGGSPLLGTILDPAAAPGILDAWPRGIIPGGIQSFRDLSTMASTVTGPAETILGQFEVLLQPGRLYRLEMPWRTNPSSTTAGSVNSSVKARATFTTDGSTPPDPTTSSLLVADSSSKVPPGSTAGESGVLIGYLPLPASAATVRAKVCVSLFSQAASITVTPSLYDPTTWVAYVEDRGPATDPSAATLPGSSSQLHYTTTWTATDSRTWDQNGTIVGDAHQIYMGQGWNGAHTQFMHAAFVCNGNATAGDEKGVPMQTALTGATVLKVEVGIQSTSWELGKGELQIQRFTGAAISSPDTKPVGTMVKKAYTARNQWQWITDPSMTTWISALNRGIYVGPPDWQGAETHAQLASAFFATVSQRPQIRVTYTRAS